MPPVWSFDDVIRRPPLIREILGFVLAPLLPILTLSGAMWALGGRGPDVSLIVAGTVFIVYIISIPAYVWALLMNFLDPFACILGGLVCGFVAGNLSALWIILVYENFTIVYIEVWVDMIQFALLFGGFSSIVGMVVGFLFWLIAIAGTRRTA